MKKTAIIILTYNNLKHNKNLISSIESFTKPGTYELIVVDNQSTDGTREWLKTLSGITLILNDENVGFPKGCNQGILAASPGSDILLLNNDIVVTPNWLDNLCTALYSRPDIGAAQGLDGYYFNDRQEDEDFQTFALENNVSDPKRWFYSPVVHGYCLLIKREVLDRVGLLDEAFSPGYGEDDDFSCRVLASGYYLLKCLDCYIHHLGSLSFKNEQKYNEFKVRNRRKFMEKWGFDSHSVYGAKRDLSRLVEGPVNRVLYLGYGDGNDICRLKTRFPDAVFYGKEKNPAHTAVWEKLILPMEISHYDCAFISGDYLRGEDIHELLIWVKKKLKPQGELIVGLENIRHYSQIRELLGGNWLYNGLEPADKGRVMLTADDLERLLWETGFKDPYRFEWFQEDLGEDAGFVSGLGSLSGAAGFDTVHYGIRVRNGGRLGQPLSEFPLVSILIPALNRVEYLKEAITSALRQTYPAIEVVVSDNSTTDGVKNLVEELAEQDPRLRYVDSRVDEKRGLAKNFNCCAGLAKGKYISYLFDDDCYYPDKIQRMVEKIIQEDNISLVASRRTFIDADGKPLANFRHHVDVSEGIVSGGEAGRRLLLEGKNFIGEPTTVLFLKSAVTELPLSSYFGEELRFYLDVPLYLKLCLQGDIYFIDDPLSMFRWHGKQATFSHEKWICIDFFNLVTKSYEEGVFLESEADLKLGLKTWLSHFPLRNYMPFYRELKDRDERAYLQKFEKKLVFYSRYF